LTQSPRILPAEACLPGRDERIAVPGQHALLGTSYLPPFPPATAQILFGMGCFWGAERLFWRLDGVHSTAAGYAGGITKNPSYAEVCSGRTNHAEVALVIYAPNQIALQTLLEVFWGGHDPTQGMRQGNDRGTQYRSAIYCPPTALAEVERSRAQYQQQLTVAGHGPITTEIKTDQPLYYAEAHHQQYLHHNPNGYCGLGGCGVPYQAPATS